MYCRSVNKKKLWQKTNDEINAENYERKLFHYLIFPQFCGKKVWRRVYKFDTLFVPRGEGPHTPPPTVFFPHPNSIKLYGYIPQNFTLTLKPFCKTFSFLLTFRLSLFIKLPYFMNHNLDKRNLCKFDFSIKEYIFFVYTAHWEPENSGNRKTTLQQ